MCVVLTMVGPVVVFCRVSDEGSSDYPTDLQLVADFPSGFTNRIKSLKPEGLLVSSDLPDAVCAGVENRLACTLVLFSELHK